MKSLRLGVQWPSNRMILLIIVNLSIMIENNDEPSECNSVVLVYSHRLVGHVITTVLHKVLVT